MFQVRYSRSNLISWSDLCSDPCVGKNCGPHGVCQDSAGVALCKCSNGLQSDGSLCEGRWTNYYQIDNYRLF